MRKAVLTLFTFACCGALCLGGDTMLIKGTDAPAFELKNAEGTVVKLSEYRDGKFVVLIFYPGDETPVCTKQLCEIRDDYASFEKKGAVVFGVNPASVKSHSKFAGKHNLQFPLLIDKKSKVAAAYGAKGPIMNKRTVYVIDKAGKIIYAQRGKPPVAEILAAIPAPQGDTAAPPANLKLELK
ncbi:MAG: peroxiredoxin [Chitinispirillaceae bacterium]|nr:peroxiredoxin [Chitinispirillaceae bacterium]